MSDWSEAADSWHCFLNRVFEAKTQVNCSYVNAWFRGECDSKRGLVPSIFRTPSANILDEGIKAEIHSVESEIEKRKKRCKDLREEWTQLEETKKQMRRQNVYNRNDDKLRERERDLTDAMTTAKRRLDDSEQKLRMFGLACRGEREAFDEYSFRAGTAHNSSWETLAEMRHHGVPTRLLDWTEDLENALYFALENYFRALNAYWVSHRAREDKARIEARREAEQRKENSKLKFPDREPMPFHDPALEPRPCIWVLNPYAASRLATGKRQVWNIVRYGNLDYHRHFIENRSWKFEKPVPIYSPWKSERIGTQRGMFTVHGLERSPLDQQFDAKTIVQVTMDDSKAAIYAVRYLKAFRNFDRFVFFRDLDSLSERIRTTFFES